MKQLFKNKKIIILCMGFIIGMMGMHKLCKAAFKIQDIRWYFDERFSDLGQKAIIRFGYDCCLENFDGFAQQLKKQFSAIKQVTMCQDSSGIVKINIESIEPTMRINNSWIMSVDGVRVRADLFEDEMVSKLPHIEISQDMVLDKSSTKKKKKTSKRKNTRRRSYTKKKVHINDSQQQAFIQWVTKVPKILLSTYRVIWDDQFHVWLQDKKQKKIFILSEAEQKLTPFIMSTVQQIKHDLQERGTFLRVGNWVIDVRFADHVIVFREQGGIKNGTGIS